jgi:endonuclease YncB( thermonuclease family)
MRRGTARSYPIRVLHVTDGDTISAEVDLGFYVATRVSLRLDGLDTPELNAPSVEERNRAAEAKAFVESRLAGASEVHARTDKPRAGDKYGRWLATILYRVHATEPWRELNADLLAAGLAKPYDGKARS